MPSESLPVALGGSTAGNPTDMIELVMQRYNEIVATLNDAIAAGGSSLRDYRQADGELGYFQHSFRVYDREGDACPTNGCPGTIRRIVQSGRSTFHCPKCQR